MCFPLGLRLSTLAINTACCREVVDVLADVSVLHDGSPSMCSTPQKVKATIDSFVIRQQTPLASGIWSLIHRVGHHILIKKHTASSICRLNDEVA